MLASITPLGERGRRRRWGVTAPAYVTGSVLGGLAVGLLAGALGRAVLAAVDLSTTARLVVLLVALVLAVALDLRLGGLRTPGPKRQVNEEWLDVYREWVYGAGFGAQLGAAVLTQVATAAVWAMLLAAALTGSLLGGAVVGLVFGAVRAVPLVLTRRVHTPDALRVLHTRVAAWERPVHRATVGALAATGALVVSTLLMTTGPALGGAS